MVSPQQAHLSPSTLGIHVVFFSNNYLFYKYSTLKIITTITFITYVLRALQTKITKYIDYLCTAPTVSHLHCDKNGPQCLTLYKVISTLLPLQSVTVAIMLTLSNNHSILNTYILFIECPHVRASKISTCIY